MAVLLPISSFDYCINSSRQTFMKSYGNFSWSSNVPPVAPRNCFRNSYRDYSETSSRSHSILCLTDSFINYSRRSSTVIPQGYINQFVQDFLVKNSLKCFAGFSNISSRYIQQTPRKIVRVIVQVNFSWILEKTSVIFSVICHSLLYTDIQDISL